MQLEKERSRNVAMVQNRHANMLQMYRKHNKSAAACLAICPLSMCRLKHDNDISNAMARLVECSSLNEERNHAALNTHHLYACTFTSGIFGFGNEPYLVSAERQRGHRLIVASPSSRSSSALPSFKGFPLPRGQPRRQRERGTIRGGSQVQCIPRFPAVRGQSSHCTARHSTTSFSSCCPVSSPSVMARVAAGKRFAGVDATCNPGRRRKGCRLRCHAVNSLVQAGILSCHNKHRFNRKHGQIVGHVTRVDGRRHRGAS